MALRPHLTIILLSLALLSPTATHPTSSAAPQRYRMAFGSCFKLKALYESSRIFESVYADKPDSFVWLGDFAYLDYFKFSRFGVEHDYNTLEIAKKKFEESYNDPHYVKVRTSTKIYGIWDDHDSGINNSDKNNKVKDIVRQWFLDFMDEPKDSPRRTRKGGMYEAYYLDPAKKIKLVLLDVRYQRDALKDKSILFKDKSLLGIEQEEFLKKEVLESEAHFTLIGLGNQLIHDDRLFVEKIFPKTRNLLLTLYNPKTRIVLLSGDVHFGEILKEPCCRYIQGHPMYEFTSSGLSHSVRGIFGSLSESALSFAFPDTYSTSADRFVDLNYATIDFNIDPMDMNKSSLEFRLKDVDGHTRLLKNLTIGIDMPYRANPDPAKFAKCVKSRGKKFFRVVKNLIKRGLDPTSPVLYVLIVITLLLVLSTWVSIRIAWSIFSCIWRSLFSIIKSKNE